ncbi:hypothetical protein TcasGA2_TC034307 [Tribolium castaneum]|uniref:Uncharacterized protein n=1 Tax=Tribolium castaneum TaxID=7070 RepID=A0A139WCA4_TRICA|nr:hypothetical protein TcasGA2_TC034307 [Tribolium castaneum]
MIYVRVASFSDERAETSMRPFCRINDNNDNNRLI